MNCLGFVVRQRLDDQGGFVEWLMEEADIDVPENEGGCRSCCDRPNLIDENGAALPTIVCDGEGCQPRTRLKAGSTTGEIEIWCCKP
jgi:hypothetical protein